MASTTATRTYRSPLRERRAEETRAALLAAASRSFVERGWSATGMRDVAAEAGVATETLYKHFSSKRILFQAAVDQAIVGDDERLAVADRPEFAALGAGARADRLAAAARLTREINERTAGFALVLREAAPSDDHIAAMLRATRERQRRDVEAGVALILGRRPTVIERDGVWAIVSPEVYLLLVDESGWSLEHYEAWLAATLDRVLPEGRGPR